MSETCVYIGEALARYSFGVDHPFGPRRHDAFVGEFRRRHLPDKVDVLQPVKAKQEMIEWFHDPDYVDKVIRMSKLPAGYLDGGDTPAFSNMYDATAHVVGSTLDAVDRVIQGEYKRAFIPIAGLHHARRDTAAGFCIFNDCGIAIEALRRKYQIQRVAYVDIDAHHGDGVFYSFEDDPDLIFLDMHEDGRFLYPGTGRLEETGTGKAAGTKLNIPMPMGASDADFLRVWETGEKFLREAKPEFILLQCGADSLDGDPITHMQYSEQAHAHAAERLCRLADEYCAGRIVAMGGGGYNLDNLARAWCAVVDAFVRHEQA
ncbi:MAG: acetoin utilization protein AcuC [Gammaproteobacteria bacterium]|nr:acetoin utilization protein AcuC [Gammaproteobacteria bacterium]MDH5651651.1 acetoin utilization protein AcuC [Gammaproteobacteria bacterium]